MVFANGVFMFEMDNAQTALCLAVNSGARKGMTVFLIIVWGSLTWQFPDWLLGVCPVERSLCCIVWNVRPIKTCLRGKNYYMFSWYLIVEFEL